jgi:hypothetical protein
MLAAPISRNDGSWIGWRLEAHLAANPWATRLKEGTRTMRAGDTLKRVFRNQLAFDPRRKGRRLKPACKAESPAAARPEIGSKAISEPALPILNTRVLAVSLTGKEHLLPMRQRIC